MSCDSGSGFSARSMIGKGANKIPGSLGQRSPKKLQGMGKTIEAETSKQEMKAFCSHSKHSSPVSSQPPSKTSNCKDTHGLWKSLQDCHSSLAVANPRHFEFAVANLCFLLRAYGKELDNYFRTGIDKIFQTLRILVLDTSNRPTTRMQLLRVIELRARSWDVVQSRGSKCTEKVKGHGEPLAKMDAKSSPPGTPSPSDIDKQPVPKSTGFWDSVLTIQGFSPHLPPIPEETLPSRHDYLTLSPGSEGSSPRLPEGSSPRLPEGSSPRLPEGSSPRLPEGSSPRLPEGSTPRLPEGSTLRHPEGLRPRHPEVSLPRLPEKSSPRLPEGLSPSLPERLSPRLLEGSTPQLPEGSSPRLSEESSPRLSEESSPRLPEGSSPRLPEGSSPRLLEGSSPRLLEGSSPRLSEGSSLRFPEGSTPRLPGSTSRLLEGSSCRLQYSREVLLACWDSPLCRVMPPALQHTIPHSDIWYLIKIPIFEDPSFLLKDDLAPSNIISMAWYPDQDQSNRRRHSSWPTTTQSDEVYN